MPKSPTVTAAHLIQQILKKYGWNQKELAQHLHKPQETISRWKKEKHHAEPKNIYLLERLLEQPNSSPTDLEKKDNQYSLSINVNLNEGNVKMSIDKLGETGLADLLSALIGKLTKKENPPHGLD